MAATMPQSQTKQEANKNGGFVNCKYKYPLILSWEIFSLGSLTHKPGK